LQPAQGIYTPAPALKARISFADRVRIKLYRASPTACRLSFSGGASGYTTARTVEKLPSVGYKSAPTCVVLYYATSYSSLVGCTILLDALIISNVQFPMSNVQFLCFKFQFPSFNYSFNGHWEFESES
jgi:hypothetical protein